MDYQDVPKGLLHRDRRAAPSLAAQHAHSLQPVSSTIASQQPHSQAASQQHHGSPAARLASSQTRQQPASMHSGRAGRQPVARTNTPSLPACAPSP